MGKIVKFPIVRMIVAVLCVGTGILVGQMALNFLRLVFSISDPGLTNLLAFLLVAPAAYFGYWLYVRHVERRHLHELERSGALREFGLGAFLGLGLFSLVMGVLWILGYYRISGVNFILLSLIGALVGALVSAFAQELIFRAIIYRITEEWLGTWWAVAVSALLFGLIHLSSSGATIVSAAAIALQAGVLLAAVYALTHRLWMAVGLHTAWDFANDGVFGVGVAAQSGDSLQGLFQASLHGPPLLTGGSLGVEVSMISLVIVSIAAWLLLQRAYQNGQFAPGKSQRKTANMQMAGHGPDSS